MESNLTGACQRCGGPLEFPAESVGAVVVCPHCGLSSKLKPADHPALEQEILAQAQAKTDITTEENVRLRRSLIKLAILTGVLVAVVGGLIAAANWLAHRVARKGKK